MRSIALAMIVRDEARCISRCLASMKPWVDRIVVLDTGSRDATIELAKASGAQVWTADWRDDFAWARNLALEYADADWNVVLDADEWLEAGGHALRALRDESNVFAGQVRVDSQFDCDDGVGTAPSWMARVLPRGARFAGRIHEQAEPGLTRRRLGVRLGHDGYRRERQDSKRGRNLRLLGLALQDQPDDPYLNYQMGKDLEFADRYETASGYYQRALELGAPTDPWRHDLVLRLMYALKRSGQFSHAFAVAQAERARWEGSPDFFFVLGDVLLDWAIAEPDRAATLLPQIEAQWCRCLALGEQPDREGAVHGRGSFLAAKNLAAYHAGLGQSQTAARYRRLESELRAAVLRPVG